MLLDGVQEPAPHQLIFGGRCSTLIATESGPDTGSDPLRIIQNELARIDPAADWAEMCSLARQGRRLAREQGRIAECFELMQQWHAAAGIEDDRAVLNESAREMVWILEGWGRTEEAARLSARTVNRMLSGVVGFYEFQARRGSTLAKDLVVKSRSGHSGGGSRARALNDEQALAVRAPLPVLVATTDPSGLTGKPPLAHVRTSDRQNGCCPLRRAAIIPTVQPPGVDQIP
jgi:hypothetical protein